MKAIKYNDVNLYLKYIENPEKEQKRRTIIKLAIPVVLLFVAAAVITAFLLAQVGMLTLDSQLYAATLSDIEQNADYEEAYFLDNEAKYYSHLLDGLKDFNDTKETYPDISTEVIENIYSCNDGSIEIQNISVSSADGALLLTADAQNELKVSDYVEKLRNSGKYESVTYSGYVREEGENAGEGEVVIAQDDRFDVEIVCVLKVKESEVIQDEQ